MSATQIDCPICMDTIGSISKNCVTTECGHCFHASCLMQSVAHNGFGCPYCRTKMAEEPEEDDDSEFEGEEEEMFDDDALRGFRFFWNTVNGEEHDEEDDADEQQLEEWEDVDEEQDENIPTPEFVAEKLRYQGYTYEQLVQLLLYKDHQEYDVDDERIERLDGEIFGRIRIIVSNYEPEQQQRVSSKPESVQDISKQVSAEDSIKQESVVETI